jgi:ferric-dicitrate binding protein FerR (iron transport regulator)
MSSHDALSPEDREALVQYLDGEMDEEQSRVFEARLASNPTLRREAETLKRTWELLDYLPRPVASETFTSRTLEKVETCRMTTLRRRRAWRWVGGAAWAAAATAAALLGFLTIQPPLPPEPFEPTPEDIRIYEHREYWHYYEKVDSLEFLKALERERLFPEDT